MESNAVQAVIWFSQAAGQGHEYAMYALGKLNLEAGNASAARRWFEKAANLGNQFAQYQLGKLLLQGDGVSKDVEEAVRQFTASANCTFWERTSSRTGTPPSTGSRWRRSRATNTPNTSWTT